MLQQSQFSVLLWQPKFVIFTWSGPHWVCLCLLAINFQLCYTTAELTVKAIKKEEVAVVSYTHLSGVIACCRPPRLHFEESESQETSWLHRTIMSLKWPDLVWVRMKWMRKHMGKQVGGTNHLLHSMTFHAVIVSICPQLYMQLL